MAGQGARRRVHKRKSPKTNSGMKFVWIIGIMVLAVLLGYLTARFVVGPIIGYNSDESHARIIEKSGNDVEGKDTKDENAENASAIPSDGYALQFGAFSTIEAARSMAETLKRQGIKTKIVEADSVFKVISPVVETKGKALNQLEEISNKDVEDVFIADFT